MRNGLIFSQSFDGHRQVHVFVYAYIMHRLGFKVFIAGDFQEKIINSFYIDRLKNDKSITLIDINEFQKKGYGISAIEDFVEIQEKNKIDLTVFAEADNHISLFTSQIKSRKKLSGINIGLFFRPFYFYEKRSFLKTIKYIKRLPTKWKADNALFHEYLLHKYKLLHTALYLDENFTSRHKYSRLLPDVFQSYADLLLKDEHAEQRIWIDHLNNFIKQNKEKFIFLYFGTAQKRRGYHILLKLAVQTDSCFVHCGLFHPNEKYDFDINQLKNFLKEKGRLLETNEYISDPVTIDYFFKSIDHLILPYQDFHGSSGVMLQALGYRIPVLVAEKGVMGYLVKKYNLGLSYNYSSELFEDQLKKFIKTPAATYKTSIEEYMKSQSPEQLENILADVFSQVNRSQKSKQ